MEISRMRTRPAGGRVLLVPLAASLLVVVAAGSLGCGSKTSGPTFGPPTRGSAAGPTAPPATAPPGAAPAKYQATIRWTSHGVPHITADNLGDLAFGQAFAFARHHVCVLADQIVKLRSERAKMF